MASLDGLETKDKKDEPAPSNEVVKHEAKKPKLDRTKMSEDEKKREIDRQNLKRKVLRAKELAQEKKDVIRRNRMKEDRIKIIRALCTVLGLDITKTTSENLKKALAEAAEKSPDDENMDDLNASDFDSSASEEENGGADSDETDDEIDEEERQLFRVVPWDRKKYMDTDTQTIRVVIDCPAADLSHDIILSGLDASLSVLFREMINDAIKNDQGITNNITVRLHSKYSKQYIDCIRLYCEMYAGCRPIYKVERPMKSNVILDSCIPIELNTADAKVFGFPIGRQSVEDAKIQSTFDVIFYELLIEAKIDIPEMLEIADFYNIIGFKELLAAAMAIPIKQIDDDISKLGMFQMCEKLIKTYQTVYCGANAAKYDAKVAEALAECKHEIEEFNKQQEAGEQEAGDKKEQPEPVKKADDHTDKKEGTELVKKD